MRLSVRTFLGLLAASCGVASAAERVITRDFPVNGPASLAVELPRGGVVVTESDDPVIHLELTLDALGHDDHEGEQLLSTVNPACTQTGSAVSISLANPNPSGVRFDWNDDQRISIECRISVPRRCSVSTTTRDGTVTIGNLTGAVVARARSGTIYVKGIDGTVDARTQTGDLILSHCTGAVTLATGQGDIRVGPVEGHAILRTDSGEIDVRSAAKGVEAHSEAGGISVGFPAQVMGPSILSADGGSVAIKVAPKAQLAIEASSVWGHVASTLPLQVKSGGNGRRSLSGTLNGGGPLVKISASGGNVTLGPDPFAGDVP